MNKLRKALRSMTHKERAATLLLLEQLVKDYKKVPGIQSIKGKRYHYRVRIGRYRIIFAVLPKNKTIEIRSIRRRNEATYRGM